MKSNIVSFSKYRLLQGFKRIKESCLIFHDWAKWDFKEGQRYHDPDVGTLSRSYIQARACKRCNKIQIKTRRYEE